MAEAKETPAPFLSSVVVFVHSFSHVRLFLTPWIVARKACPSLTISQRLPKFMCIALMMPSSHLILRLPLLCSVLSDSLPPHGLLCPWNFPGKNTEAGCHPFLQGIVPTQGLNPGLLHCRQILYSLNHQGGSLTIKSYSLSDPIVPVCEISMNISTSLLYHPTLFQAFPISHLNYLFFG